MSENITVTIGNSKIGTGIATVSLPPGKTCNQASPCTRGGCYMYKLCAMRPCVRAAYKKNLRIFEASPMDYFNQIESWIHKNESKIRFFRWHVSGDMPSMRYAEGVLSTAKRFSDVKSLLFTKQDRFLPVFQTKPDNLSVVFSMWPGFFPDTPIEEINSRFPIAWLYDKRNIDPRIPKDAFPCAGKCDSCFVCWNLKPGQSVVFNKH